MSDPTNNAPNEPNNSAQSSTPQNQATQQQVDIANSLNNVLNEIESRFESINRISQSQSAAMLQLVDNITLMQNVASTSLLNSTRAVAIIIDAGNDIVNTFGSNFYQQMNTAAANVAEVAANGITQNARSLSELGEASSEIAESTAEFSETVAKQANQLAQGHHRQSDMLNEYNSSSQEALDLAEDFSEDMEKVSIRVKSLTSGLMTGVGNILSAGLGIFKMALSGFGTLMSAGLKFVKFSLSLPFTITKAAAELGNKLRSDIVTVIQQASEDLKEKFDMNSNIGKGILSLSKRSKNMLLAFQSPTHKLVKWFDMGAAGLAKMTSEFGQHLEAMGHFSELFGRSLGNNQKRLERFFALVKGLGLSAEDVGYFAQDAGINLKHIDIRLAELGVTLSNVSKEYGVDRKRLSKNFMILRKDITEFGHLTDEEILKTTASLTQMRIKLEDAAAVFKKFSTFEDAANSVAILSQTFGMNLDAFDMIQAKNPKEIIDMFRNSMLETGRSFQDLNRFEKDLMAQHTGMSAESLKALMHYKDLGYTHEQAVKKMESEKPHAKQMKALKSLNSAIKEIQRIMQFTSPFEAFADGLAANATLSGELKTAMVSLSKGYEGIYEYARKLEPDKWEGLARPIRMIIDIMKNILQSEEFKNGLTAGLEAISGFVAKMFGISNPDRILNEVKTSIKAASKKGGALDKKINKSFHDDFTNALKNIPDTFLDDFKSIHGWSVMDVANINSPDEFIKFLDVFEKAKSSHPEMAPAFQKLMNIVSSNIQGIRYKDAKSEKQVTVTKTFSESLRNNLLEISKLNSGNASKLFDLSGRVMKAIIKGASVAFITVMKVVNDTIEGAGNMTDALSPNESLFEKFLKFNPGELSSLATQVGDALTRFLNNSQGLMSIGRWIFDGFKSIFSAVIDVFLYTFALGVDSIFGSQYSQSPKKALKATQIAAARPQTEKTVESLNEYEASSTHDLRFEHVASILHDMKDRINLIDDKSQTSPSGVKVNLSSLHDVLKTRYLDEDTTSKEMEELAKTALSAIANIQQQLDSNGNKVTSYTGDFKKIKDPFKTTANIVGYHELDAHKQEQDQLALLRNLRSKMIADQDKQFQDIFEFKSPETLSMKAYARDLDFQHASRVKEFTSIRDVYSNDTFRTFGGWALLDEMLIDKSQSPIERKGRLTTVKTQDVVTSPFDVDSIDKLPISQNILDDVVFGYSKTYSISPVLSSTNVALYDPESNYGEISSNIPSKNKEKFTSADAKKIKEALLKEKEAVSEPLVCDVVPSIDKAGLDTLMKSFVSNNFVKYLTRADLLEGVMGIDIDALISRCFNEGSNTLAPDIELK